MVGGAPGIRIEPSCAVRLVRLGVFSVEIVMWLSQSLAWSQNHAFPRFLDNGGCPSSRLHAGPSVVRQGKRAFKEKASVWQAMMGWGTTTIGLRDPQP